MNQPNKIFIANKITSDFLFSHPAHFIALGAGSGLYPRAPGTAGTVLAWIIFIVADYFIIFNTLPIAYYLLGATIVLFLAMLLSWWACKVTAVKLNTPDPSAIVCDEIVAFWLILVIAALGPKWVQLLAFILFRLFDAVKVGPVAWADKHFKGFGWNGAWGIMLDDFVAALLTLIIIAPLVIYLA